MDKLLLILFSLCSFSCTYQKQLPVGVSEAPLSPDTLALHFWDQSDFKNFDLSQHGEMPETMFIEYLQTLDDAEPSARKESIDIILNRAGNENPSVFEYFISLFEKYLYNPNSPIRNEELYIPVLQYIAQSQTIDEISKIRYASQLEMLSKNRPGEIATDFEYILQTGKKDKLSNIEAEYIIIFFHNPDCRDCARVKEMLSSVNSTQVKILSIYPDRDLIAWKKIVYPKSWINGYNYKTIHQHYDLKAIPTLYLLDENKRIILKDAPVEEIMEYMKCIP